MEEIKKEIARTAVKEFFSLDKAEYDKLSQEDKNYIKHHINSIDSTDAFHIMENCFGYNSLIEVENNIFMLKTLQEKFLFNCEEILNLSTDSNIKYTLVLELLGREEFKKLVNERVKSHIQDFFEEVYLDKDFEEELSNSIISNFTESSNNKWALYMASCVGDVYDNFEDFKNDASIKRYVQKHGTQKIMKEFLKGSNRGFYSPNYYYKTTNDYIKAFNSLVQWLPVHSQEHSGEIKKFISSMLREINESNSNYCILAVNMLEKYLSDAPNNLKVDIKALIIDTTKKLKNSHELTDAVEVLFEKLNLSLNLRALDNKGATLKI